MPIQNFIINKQPIVIQNHLLKHCGNYLNKYFNPQIHQKVVIITDQNIAIETPWLRQLLPNLEGYTIKIIVLHPGEKTKNLKTYTQIAERILRFKITRNDFLIALGGGVIGDLTGFLAGTLLRGIDFVQIPTTLLAQIDSSVGGKTAINSQYGKNLIGTFKRPSLVLIDPNSLSTLDQRNIKNGYIEAIKIALISDRKLFDWCDQNYQKIIHLEPKTITYLIAACIKHKLKIVKHDPEEKKGIRQVLNLGHTFGHVYEVLADYNPRLILHGEAVGIGIIQAMILSNQLGYLNDEELKLVLAHFNRLKMINFSTIKHWKNYRKIKNFSSYLIRLMRTDKKATNSINLVLNKAIGKSIFVKDVKPNAIKKMIKKNNV